MKLRKSTHITLGHTVLLPVDLYLITRAAFLLKGMNYGREVKNVLKAISPKEKMLKSIEFEELVNGKWARGSKFVGLSKMLQVVQKKPRMRVQKNCCFRCQNEISKSRMYHIILDMCLPL